MDNTFLREAIEKIEELTDSAREPHVVKIAGKTYCDKSMSRYDREEFAEQLTATSLNSLIDYISGKSEELRESMIIHVESPTRVRLLSGLTQERNREELFRVDTNPNGFDFDHYYDQEAFVINMQTAFKQSDETKLILSVAGNVENKTVANYGDDGVSQKATITKGIAGKEDVIVPNPVTLRLMFPTKKPDIDNIAKSILDALNKLAYRDDTQVVTLHMEKHYAENPRVEVEIEEIK